MFSDHGEGLGDHGEESHGYFIYQSTLHVPLIFHWPAGFHAQPQPGGGLIDVAPTILDFLHIPVPLSFEGTSLLNAAPRAVYSETLHTHDSFGWAPLRSLRIGNDKYIEAPKPELYDLAKDPAERTNLILVYPARARTMRTELGKLIATHAKQLPPATGSVNPQTEKLLTSLGYLAHGPTMRRPSAGPDPKDRLAEFHLYERAIQKVADRRLEQAVGMLKQVLAQDSANTLARRDLASCYLDLHDYAKARLHFQQVVKTAPQDYPSQFGLGLAAEHSGRSGRSPRASGSSLQAGSQASQCRVELSDLLRRGGVSHDIHHGVVGQQP